MAFVITDEIAQEIKEYCVYQEYDEDDYRITCKYCVFNSPKKCRLYNETMGFPSEWNV